MQLMVEKKANIQKRILSLNEYKECHSNEIYLKLFVEKKSNFTSYTGLFSAAPFPLLVPVSTAFVSIPP